ncbi:MAG: N-acetylmuramoyl-L-alanine amidase [Candidatus Desulforudis sp.]|nr:N-acetylmuramoyl-L-alanine amidase [Desulforudis sp.]
MCERQGESRQAHCRPGAHGGRWRLFRRVLGILLMILVFSAQFSGTVEAAGRRMVVIDPGHGGDDPGAVDKANGVFEKTVNLQVARRTQAALGAAGHGVFMTREDDELLCQADGGFVRRHISLNERAQVANANAAEVFLSIHSNIFYDPDCSGAEIYYYHLSEEGRLLAGEVKRALGEMRIECRIKPADYFVLRKTSMPAILIEMGYMSHPREGRMLLEPTYQQVLAEAFAKAVNNYLRQSRLGRDASP